MRPPPGVLRSFCLALPTATPWQAYKAWDEVNGAPPVEGQIGLIFHVTRHQMLEVSCRHSTRALPWGTPADSLCRDRGQGEWRLVGPRLAGLIVFLALRMRLSRRRIREPLRELFGFLLSIGVIDETIREADRASYPLKDALIAEVR